MPAKIVEVQRGIYELFLPLPMRPTIVNVYLIDCGGGQWALVDTGMNTADSVATLKDAFAQAGTRLEDLTVLLGTHHHVDHFGASGTIKGLSHARTYLHDLEVERVNRMLNAAAAVGQSRGAGVFHRSRLSNRSIPDRRDAAGVDGHRSVQPGAAARRVPA